MALHNNRMSITGPRAAPGKLDGRLHSLHCENITGMSNSVDELKARHNHCHLYGAGTCTACSQGRNPRRTPRSTPSRARRSHKTMTMYLSGSKSVSAHRRQIRTCPTTSAAPSGRRGLHELATRPAEYQAACAILPSAPHGARSTVRHRS